MKMRYYSHYKKWHNHNDPNYVDFMQRKFRNTFDDNLPQLRNAAILEIGCANGMALLTLKNMGYTNLLGIELDEELASIARSFDLNVANTDAIRFINETEEKYDFIYMFDVLEHFSPDIIPQFLQGVFNRLNVNGKLMLVVPNATSPAGSYFRYIDWTHQVSFTPTSISHLLEEAGFKEITIEDESLIPDPKAEDFNSEKSYLDAKQRADKARFYESFARWQMKSMFGDNPLNLLVAPNMKVVAVNSSEDSLEFKLKVHEDELFDLYDFVRKTSDSKLDFEDAKNVITIHVEDLETEVSSLKEKQRTHNLELKEIQLNLEQLTKHSNEKFLEVEESQLQLKRDFELEKINQSEELQKISTLLQEHIYSSMTEMKTQVLEQKQLNRSLEKETLKLANYLKEEKRLNNAIFHYLKLQARKNSSRLLKRINRKLTVNKQRALIINSGYFDIEYYSKKNPDVISRGMDPIKHYILYGALEGRDPSGDFSTDEYYKKNLNILLEGINPLVHKIMSEKGSKL